MRESRLPPVKHKCYTKPMKRGYKYCDWCMDEVKNTEKVCEECLPDWQECEDQLAPIRLKAANAKCMIDASSKLRSAINEAIEVSQKTLRNLENRQMNLDGEVCVELARVLEIDSVELGSHKCHHSPTGKCFYNEDEDPCNDSCLVCGQPDERK